MCHSNAEELLEELTDAQLDCKEKGENADVIYQVPLNDLERDYAELNQRLTVLHRRSMDIGDHPELLRGIDMRPDLLRAYEAMCHRSLRLEMELDFGDIAAALSYGIRFQDYKEVMISYAYTEAALPIIHHLMQTNEGRRLLRRVRSTFEMLFHEEPELVRELGWGIL